MSERNRLLDLIVVAVAVLSVAAGSLGGFSVFGFRTHFWDLGLLPILAALIIGLFQLGGRRRRFLIGFEACGSIACLVYIASCSGPARWSLISALLPFQTGFWLDPEMKTSGVVLTPWKIAVDAVILASIPFVPALSGGLLVSTRITLRRMMVLVAAIAVVFGVGSAYLRRVRHYDDMGQYHRRQIVSVLVGSVAKDGVTHFSPSGSDRLGKPVTNAQRRLDVWHEAMAQTYWKAARYPWIAVGGEQPPE